VALDRGNKAKAPSLQLETRSLSGEFPKRELESGEFDLAIARILTLFQTASG
jgi:hypothetical protein